MDDALEIRPDIDSAFEALDPAGQAALVGLRASRQVRKGLQGLPELIPNEEVIALAAVSDPPPTAGEQRSMGAAAAFGQINQVRGSARLLVLTETCLWEVQASGILNGNRPKGISTLLESITDVRPLSERKLGRFGAKQHLLAVDHIRGATVETIMLEVAGSDDTLMDFAEDLVEQVASLQSEHRESLETSGAPISVADELAKLSSLVQRGILTQAEFVTQKAKLLERD